MEVLAALGAMAFQLVFMAAIVLTVLAVGNHQRKRQQSNWARVASRYGLTLTPGGFLSSPVLRGQVDGVDVNVTVVNRSQGKSSVAYTVVQAACPVALPPRLEVTREGYGDAIVKLFGGQDIQLGDSRLDPDLRIKGVDEDAVREVLRADIVRPLLPTLLAAGHFSRIEHGRVVLEERGRGDSRLEHHVGASVELARALAQAVRSPWEELAERTGLALTGGGGSVEYRGVIENMYVEVRVLVGRADPGPHTTVRVRLPDDLPTMGISLADRKDPSGGLRLGDPVLDGLIRVDTARPSSVRSLLTGPAAMEQDLHGKLLAVVHGRPGSVVSEREVRVVGPGSTARHAGELLDEAVALAGALRAAARAGGPEAEQAAARDDEATERVRRALAARQRS